MARGGTESRRMVRTLRAFGVLALISAFSVFALFTVHQLQGATETEQNQDLPILERFKQAGIDSKNTVKEELPPLVRQAEAFALYLNPPEPPKPKINLSVYIG
jgi:hypothetical protein